MKLTGIDKVLYKQAYNFAIKVGKTEEQAHAEGLDNIKRVKGLAEQIKDEKYIDITTGKQVVYRGW